MQPYELLFLGGELGRQNLLLYIKTGFGIQQNVFSLKGFGMMRVKKNTKCSFLANNPLKRTNSLSRNPYFEFFKSLFILFSNSHDFSINWTLKYVFCITHVFQVLHTVCWKWTIILADSKDKRHHRKPQNGKHYQYIIT